VAVKPAVAPKHLGAAGKALWVSIAAHWAGDDLTPDAREARLLADACAEADMLATLEAALAAEVAEGRLIVKGSQGQPVTSSLVAECRRSRAQVAALLGKLGMDDPSESSKPGRGGRTTSAQARAAAYARHGAA
jgi:hypothetical protein